MRPSRLLLCLFATAPSWCADVTPVDTGCPVGTTVLVAPLSIEEAQKWTSFSQVMPVKEKEAVLVDTADTKGTVVIVQSISYFRGSTGQVFAVVNCLRPRVVAKEPTSTR